MSENLYQRKGTWWIRYNVDGKQVRQSLGTKSLKEAKRLRNEVLGARDAARDPRAKLGLPAVELKVPEPRPVPTLGELADKWLQHREADSELSEHSRDKSRTAIEVHIRPELGRRIMSTITREDIEAFVAKLRARKGRKGRKASPTTVANTFVQLRALVRWSMRRGLFAGPDFTDLEKPPRPGPGRDVVLTVDEARAFLSELIGRWHVMASVALFAGLRWGEVNGLKWEDIDLDADPATLSVRRSYRDGAPKTAESKATLPLHAELAALLRIWKRERSGEWLFPARKAGAAKSHATQMDYDVIRKAAERAKIAKDVTPHVFRHSFGTLLYETTEDTKAVQRLMRHRSLATTMK